MKSLLIKQAIVVPLVAMLVPMFFALFLPGYSSVSQHLSELELLHHPIAPITRVASIICGASVFLFGVGVVLAPYWARFTAVCTGLAGAAMVSNGVFVMGNPLHGLYGLALFTVLVPACFAVELGQSRKIVRLSLGASLLTMIYFWLQLSGLDPQGFRGLTQRIAVVIIFGWYTLAGYHLMRGQGPNNSFKPNLLRSTNNMAG